mgnify:CR=1 FL=1
MKITARVTNLETSLRRIQLDVNAILRHLKGVRNEPDIICEKGHLFSPVEDSSQEPTLISNGAPVFPIPSRAEQFRVEQIVRVKCSDTYFKISEILSDGTIKGFAKDGQQALVNYPDYLCSATPAEIAEFYTCVLAGHIVRAYEEDDDDVLFLWDKYDSDYLFEAYPEVAHALCLSAHIPIMPYVESRGKFDPPI